MLILRKLSNTDKQHFIKDNQIGVKQCVTPIFVDKYLSLFVLIYEIFIVYLQHICNAT